MRLWKRFGQAQSPFETAAEVFRSYKGSCYTRHGQESSSSETLSIPVILVVLSIMLLLKSFVEPATLLDLSLIDNLKECTAQGGGNLITSGH